MAFTYYAQDGLIRMASDWNAVPPVHTFSIVGWDHMPSNPWPENDGPRVILLPPGTVMPVIKITPGKKDPDQGAPAGTLPFGYHLIEDNVGKKWILLLAGLVVGLLLGWLIGGGWNVLASLLSPK